MIINCSSVHEIIPKPGYIAYSLSKGGLGNLTRRWRSNMPTAASA